MSDPLDVHELMPDDQWHHYVDAWCAGWVIGVEEGRRRADAEASARHRAAAEVVTAMIRVPVVDRDEAAARRGRIDARFTTKGGVA